MRELVSFTAIHWHVAKRRGVRPAELTASCIARLQAQDAALFEERCAAQRLPVSPIAQAEEAARRAQRYFRRCIQGGEPPAMP